MTVLSAQTIRRLGLISPCCEPSRDFQGNSYGLSACGYDLTLDLHGSLNGDPGPFTLWPGDFVLLSAVEQFHLPADIVGIIHDKSSLARRGLAVQNTVAEPGWNGYLTLELTNHHPKNIIGLHHGMAICQVIFHFLDEKTELSYNGKYQNQARGPQEAR